MPELDIMLTADGRGQARVDGLSTSGDENCPFRVDIIISADGYGDFTFKNLPLFPGGTTMLTPRLREEPVVDDETNLPRALAGIECAAVLPETGITRESGSAATAVALALASLGVFLLAAGGVVALRLRR